MNVKPINYSLEFEPDLKKFTFNGREKIELECTKRTNKIILNAAELKIKRCFVEKSQDIIKAKTKLDKKDETLAITLPKKISGKCFLYVDFVGTLNDRLLGFYRSQYKQNNKTKYLATTQFEAADARRAFPCWDEPAVKATFDISIITEHSLSAISNMPEISKKRKGNKIVHKFDTTPVMSTYLVYLGAGDFEYLKGKADKIDIRIVTAKGNRSKGKYALDLSKKLLREYESYFGIKYPLPKLDLIAVPDFAAGAMENWGAITFRETILLFDPKKSSTRTKQFIAEVISHEIAHQWFGNLVTMKWWNDLWLNESFATFMATKFVDRFYPEWNLWDQFLEDAMNTAMSLDALKTTHPIDVKVKSPQEIREIFDPISYDKGGCILRMLEDYVGEKNFRNGLKKYLAAYKYQNASGQDLWKEIGKASKMPVSSMVNSWLNQPGFPLVEVTKKDSRLSVKQSRFLLEPNKKYSKGRWHIPFSAGLNKPHVRRLVTKKSETIKIPKKGIGFVANLGRSGFYRVKYDDSALLDLKLLADMKKIIPVDRWSIQNDLFSLCMAGKESVRNYLDFTDAYHDETDYLPSINVANNLNLLFRLTFWAEYVSEIRAYCLHYFKRILSKTGWDPKKSENHTDALLRSFAIATLARLGDNEIISEAENRFKKFLKRPSSLHPDIQEPVFSVVAWNGNSGTHARLISLYKKAKTMEEKLRFLSALCNFQDERLILKTLDFSQTPNVRSQNMQLPIMRVSANPYGRRILWPWLKKNWKKLSRKVGYGNPLFNRIVASIAQVSDESMINDIRRFFKDNPVPGTERTQQQTIERIRIYSKFLKEIQNDFKITI